jgi:glycine hydroxymethyltransferase
MDLWERLISREQGDPITRNRYHFFRDLLNMTIKTANILFVCTGNICRSAFAHAFFTTLVNQRQLPGIVSDSAGLLALAGNPATHMARRVAGEFGVDLDGHRAKSLSKALVAWSGLILVMENSHMETLVADFSEARGKTRLIRNFARFGSKQRGIADPYGLQYDAYRFCFLDIEDAVSGLADFLARP